LTSERVHVGDPLTEQRGRRSSKVGGRTRQPKVWTMTRNTQRIPSILTQAWVAAACFGLAGASFGHGFEMGEVAIATGYRQDSSSFAICSGLASPDYYGFGKLRARDVHMWEIGIGASASLTDHAYLRAALSYGVILGGKVRDSGVADINSNPANSVLGEFYTDCCAPCNCDDKSCQCDCQDKIFRESVQATANLRGNAVDFNVALGYAFRPMDDFMLAPVVGWTYNSQRQRWVDSIYGPIQMSGQAEPCPVDGTEWTPGPGGIPNYINAALPDVTLQTLNLGAVTDGAVSSQVACVSFGNCFDGTVYRARWNGPFIGVDLGYAISDVWNVVVGYALSYCNLNAKFQTFTSETDQGCNCDQCPTFYDRYGAAPGTPQSLGFVPSEMSFSSWGLGQEISIATDYRCGNWTAGLGIGWTYRNATQCAESDPCVSCETTRNPETALVSSNTSRPVWSYAQLTKARWGSFSALVTLGYQF
jgi:hypothetical protein